jgi:hypothetical protein
MVRITFIRLVFLMAMVMAMCTGGCGPSFDECETLECCKEALESCGDGCDYWRVDNAPVTPVERSSCYSSCTIHYHSCETRVTALR